METETLSYSKRDDLTGLSTSGIQVDLRPFLGSWINTKPNTGHIVKALLTEDHGTLQLHCYAASDNGLQDWGPVSCRVFSNGTNSITSIAFVTKYEFRDMEVEISANVKLGVLVIQTYTTFNDGSERCNYYKREFYGPEFQD